MGGDGKQKGITWLADYKTNSSSGVVFKKFFSAPASRDHHFELFAVAVITYLVFITCR